VKRALIWMCQLASLFLCVRECIRFVSLCTVDLVIFWLSVKLDGINAYALLGWRSTWFHKLWYNMLQSAICISSGRKSYYNANMPQMLRSSFLCPRNAVSSLKQIFCFLRLFRRGLLMPRADELVLLKTLFQKRVRTPRPLPYIQVLVSPKCFDEDWRWCIRERTSALRIALKAGWKRCCEEAPQCKALNRLDHEKP
jgi:hypothetical protein